MLINIQPELPDYNSRRMKMSDFTWVPHFLTRLFHGEATHSAISKYLSSACYVPGRAEGVGCSKNKGP
jgi:hypothetical protein